MTQLLHRTEFPRPKLLGMTVTLRGVAVALGISAAAVVAAVLADLPLLVGLGGTSGLAALLIGYLGWMAMIGWRKGPRSVAVLEDAVVVTRADGEDTLPLATLERCVIISAGGHPQFLQLHARGECYQILVQSLPPRVVNALVEAIRAWLGAHQERGGE